MSARLVIVFVVDGLRPDAITPADTPTLHRLRIEGVDFANSHAVFPTVTRVNAATLATGTQPGTHGIAGNQIFAPDVDPARALDTAAYRRLLEVDRATGGRLVLTRTYVGTAITGEKYVLTNVSGKSMVIAEQELYQAGVIAVSVEKLNLKPDESSNVFVIRSRNDHE